MITINGYPIDVAVSEALDYEADVTSFPVEKGADTTDSVRPKLPVLTVDCLVSDTPIGRVASDPSRQGVSSPANDAFNRLVEMYMNAEPLVVVCSFGTFDAMCLEKFSPSRDRTTGKALKFTATFRKLKIVQNQRTTIRVAIPNGGRRTNLGFKSGQFVKGKLVLWRHGVPPGLSPATDPKGVIAYSETVTVEGADNPQTNPAGVVGSAAAGASAVNDDGGIFGTHIYHADGTELTPGEMDALGRDLSRDQALANNQTIARQKAQLDAARDKLVRAQLLLDYKKAHPGQHVDPAMFGL